MTVSEIKQSYNIDEVIGAHLPGGLKRQGSQWVGNCPFHDDHHASLKISVSKNRFKCFVSDCGKGGDMFDFFTLQGKTLKEACDIITGGSIIPASAPRPVTPVKKWINAIPNQNNIPNPLTLSHHRYSTPPSAAWAYHDINGNIIGFTCRFDLPEGKKDVMPYSFKQQIDESNIPQGNAVWRWSELDKPRPLYNLKEIIDRPTAIVLVVEGEKTADAAKRLFPQYVVTTWIGGSDNVKYTDWSPLRGRNIFMWPDNDLAGLHAMFGGWAKNDITGEYKRITGICELFEANFKWIRNESTFPKKWDVADATWTPDQASEYLKTHRASVPTVSASPPNELPIPAAVEIVTPPVPEIPKSPAKPTNSTNGFEQPKNKYFRCLGFEHQGDSSVYVFFVFRTNVIVKLSPGGINTSNLLQLAPLNYWEGVYPKSTRSGGVKFEINTVADSLISICSRMGIFNPNKIRGRGAWIDEGVPVVHCGNTLIVNGVYTSFENHKSKFIYEAGQELGFNLVEPLKKHEAYKVVKILERLNWARNIDARLIAGWIVIAPLCGALSWRSHLWLTGASGTGKTWIMNSCVKKLIGQMLVDALSGTTEAGIRQYLGPDALPVKFDEAESEDNKGSERMRAVLEIMRASSASDSGKIIKGSGTGNAAQFELRSCFAFASIGANLTQRSDISRITVLEIKKDLRSDAKERWDETRKLHAETITEDYVAAFQSRSVRMLPTILKNAATFSNAAAVELDSQRTGDQLGALLAGAYSLTSDNIISLEDAQKWIKEKDWSEERLHESTRDEVKIINKIMDSEARVETLYGPVTRTIGELVIMARGDVISASEAMLLSEDLAKITLRRLGIRVEKHMVVISDDSTHISKILANTPYSRNYNTILCRIDGAVKMEPTTFASGIKARAVKIDSRVIFDDFQNPGLTETEIELHNMNSNKIPEQGKLFK